jgi:fumarate reductase subunit C
MRIALFFLWIIFALLAVNLADRGWTGFFIALPIVLVVLIFTDRPRPNP